MPLVSHLFSSVTTLGYALSRQVDILAGLAEGALISGVRFVTSDVVGKL